MKEQWQPSKLERRVQEFARSKASQQLLRVAWSEFSIAHRKYIRWEAFGLWIRAVVAAENALPSLVRDALKKRCPEFMERGLPIAEPGLLGVRLDEWIHDRVFARAQQEGWLDALLFYGVRDPRSRCVVAYWEKCDEEWSKKRPSSYPDFRAWFRSACRYELFHVDVQRLADSIERYVDWLSFAYWLRPLFESNRLALPERITAEVENRSPGFLAAASSVEAETTGRVPIAAQLLLWIEDRYFSDAKNGSWFDPVRGHMENHPRHVRISEYSRRWWKEGPEKRLSSYPSFEQWREAAESFIEVPPG